MKTDCKIGIKIGKKCCMHYPIDGCRKMLEFSCGNVTELPQNSVRRHADEARMPPSRIGHIHPHPGQRLNTRNGPCTPAPGAIDLSRSQKELTQAPVKQLSSQHHAVPLTVFSPVMPFLLGELTPWIVAEMVPWFLRISSNTTSPTKYFQMSTVVNSPLKTKHPIHQMSLLFQPLFH